MDRIIRLSLKARRRTTGLAAALALFFAAQLAGCGQPDEPLLYGEWRAYPEAAGETVEMTAVFRQNHTGRLSVTGSAFGGLHSKGTTDAPFRWEYNGKRINLESVETQSWQVARLSADTLVVRDFHFQYKAFGARYDSLIFEKNKH